MTSSNKKKHKDKKRNSSKPKRRKKASSKKGWSSFLWIFLLGVFIGILGVFFLFYPHYFPKKNKPSKFIYEDFSHTRLENQVFSITQQLEKTLLAAGINRSKYQEKVEYRYLQGETYPWVEFLIEKDKDVNLTFFKKALVKLGQRYKGLSVQFEPLPAKDALGIYLAWQGLITHHLIIRPKPLPPIVFKRPLVALIVDDIGYKESAVNQFLSLKIPITFSILPYSPYGRRIAQMLKGKRTVDIMLHLPLEANGHPQLNKQPGMLLLSMPLSELKTRLKQDLEAVPFIKGVNNHMGSKFTQNKSYMKIVMSEIKKRHLFFVDSLTTNRSVGYLVAREMGVPTLKRDIFLDATLNINDIKSRIEMLKRWARAKGEVVIICHPHLTTFMALKEAMPELKKEVQFVTVSSLIGCL